MAAAATGGGPSPMETDVVAAPAVEAQAPLQVKDEPVEEEDSATVDAETDTGTTIAGMSGDKLHEVVKLIQKLQRSVNKTQRSVNAILEHLEGADPKAAATKKKRAKKEPSGFAKPSLLSDDLCEFLNVPQGSKMARTEVTKKLTEYIKTNDLQNPQNRRQIILDDKLKRLLKVDVDTIVTFFNIQRFLSGYKSEDRAGGAAAAAPVSVGA